MVDGDQVDLRTNEYIIANRDAAASEEGTTLLDETSLPDRDRLTVVDVERRSTVVLLFEGFAENSGPYIRVLLQVCGNLYSFP